MRTCGSTLAILLALAWPALAIGQGQPGKTELSENAALQYWQAFNQMQTLDKDQQKILEEWSTVSPDDPAVKKLLDASHSSLLYLHRAARMPRCDWGLDYDDGVSLLLPHLAEARDLGRLAALHGRVEFERGNRRALQDDAMAIMVMARHVGRDPIMVCVLVRFVLEGLVVDLVAPHVAGIKAPHAQIVAKFEALPPAPGVLQTIDVEKKYFAAWIAKKLREEESRQAGAGLKIWKNFLQGADVPDELRQITVEEAIAKTEALLPVYDELARFVALPREQFDAQYPAFKEKTKAANPVAGLIVPAVDQLLAKERRNQARMAMLLAATAVAESGPDKLTEIKDPFGPFQYRALDKGFELKSQLVFEGQPVTLTAGQGR
jgi:hypothetical protein